MPEPGFRAPASAGDLAGAIHIVDENPETVKTINGKPSDDPLGEAFENFEQALRESCA